MAKTAGYTVEHVAWLIGVANKGLSDLECRYHNLWSEIDSLEIKKQSLANIIREYSSQITSLGKEFDNCCRRCQQEEAKLADLERKRMKEENITRYFENNNGEIRKIIEDKVRALLSNKRAFLSLATMCIMESIKENPEKYRYLVHLKHEPSVTDSITSDFNPFWIFGQPYLEPRHQQHYQSKVQSIEDYVATLTDDAEKLLEEITKKLGDEIINGYTSNKRSQPSLPLFP